MGSGNTTLRQKKIQLLRIISNHTNIKSPSLKAFKTSFRQAEFARHAISQKINLPVEKKTERADIERSFIYFCVHTQARKQHIEGTELVYHRPTFWLEGRSQRRKARALFLPLTHTCNAISIILRLVEFLKHMLPSSCVSTDLFHLQKNSLPWSACSQNA